ncbi:MULTISPECIES: hypothetical protein [unclassified Prochlorococcus]|uniref:hypothetical protein n=1 Tax=unclassified Prochlorococcus TaxID=2627481 RepID=UPI000533B57E|nr:MULTISPECIES: hypothetical protein [unclassified Prochlorococcus]KGG15124.1 hypothetical protein EV06_0989 [Prochlorococcus sp. MIT 0602]KGG17396.1 hypothetical protein EV07_0835 [Prochlorococcus sp. MIT 0603]
MFSSITIKHIQEILSRLSKGNGVSLNERIYIQKAADQDQKVSSWLKQAKRLQQANECNDAISKLLNELDLGSTEVNPIHKPSPEELGNWFSGAPSWVARS